MTNVKKVAAGFIAGAAIASAPLVAFAAPAFAATNAAKAVDDAPSHFNIPPSGYARIPQKSSRCWSTSATGGQSDASRVLVSYTSPGSLRDGNAARCGGGINC